MSVKVFISYSRKDYIDNNNNPKEDSAVGRIVDTLKQNGIEVWIDINAHYAAEYFAEVLAKQIRKADKIVFISSAIISSFANTDLLVPSRLKAQKKHLGVL